MIISSSIFVDLLRTLRHMRVSRPESGRRGCYGRDGEPATGLRILFECVDAVFDGERLLASHQHDRGSHAWEVSADVIDLEPNATRKHSSMIVDEEFHNLLVRKHWVQFDILATYAETNELLDLTIQKIEEQLAR